MSETCLGPVTVVDGPLPVAPLYTLIDTATVVPPSDDRWVNGADVYPYTKDLPTPWGPSVDGSETKPGQSEDAVVSPRFYPFAVVLPLECTAGGIGSYDEFRARLIATFTAVEHYGVERALMNGQGTPLSPYVADGGTTLPVGATAVSPTRGLAALENAIGATARAGMIHATPAAVAALDTMVYPGTGGTNGAKLRTTRGTPVVSGDGYIGANPDGRAEAGDHQAWLWATGPVQLRRGDVHIPGDELVAVMERSVNDVTLLAERYYLADWDKQLQAAVLIEWA